MHARVLVELAALLASNGEVLIRGSRHISSNCLADYWSASKCRLDRWTRSIKTAESQHPADTSPVDMVRRPSCRPWLEEIITGEILTRIWTAIICGFEKRNGMQEAEPVVRSVLAGHLEARRRTLRLLVSGQGIDTREALTLNRLRRRTERWTDMLLGYVMPLYDARDLAFDPARAVDFSDGLRSRRGTAWGAQAWPLVLSSLRAAFLSCMDPHAPNADLNQRIASSILACFGPDLFDSTGQFQSVWQIRLTHTASDTIGLIDQLLGDNPAPIPRCERPGPSFRADERWRGENL